MGNFSHLCCFARFPIEFYLLYTFFELPKIPMIRSFTYSFLGLKKTIVDVKSWASDTFGNCELGDKRRTARVVKTAQNLASNVGTSIASASPDVSHLQGSYRLIRNKNVSADAITQSGFEATARAAFDLCSVLLFRSDCSNKYYLRRSLLLQRHSLIRPVASLGNHNLYLNL